MPFARNEATRSISPTKTLEYLAGGKPVVATPISDVVKLYEEVIGFGATPAEFIAAVERALTGVLHRGQAARARAIVAEHAWDAIAKNMLALIDEQTGAARQPIMAATLNQDLLEVGYA